jgi:tripartite-type tricarboxylate transporter receptor subunit TctC
MASIRIIASGALAIPLAFGAALAAAQAYPTKPVRVMVGYVPGGGVDLAARFVANALSDHWGTTAIVDNRAGAAGGVATEVTAKATPDGYTVMLCQIASHAITPARVRNLPYDHIRDFAFPSMVGTTPNVFVAAPSAPFQTLPDFLTYAKANPGKVSFGSSGVGASPHLSIELMKTMTGINIVHVPYKGAAPALSDVMGGQIPASVGNLPGGLLSAIKAGKVRALGVTSAKRAPQAPDVPTFAEQGVTGYDVSSWYGICTQAAVPKPILAKLNADLNTVLNAPALKKRMEDQGIDVAPSTQEAFLAHVKVETEKWAKVVKDAGLVGDQ